jgi:hypothetical protein
VHSRVACLADRNGDPEASEIFHRRLRCKREMPDFPESAFWIPQLEKKFKGTKLNCLICPHRGISLETAQRHGDLAICPGHGLQWNLRTGEMVPR